MLHFNVKVADFSVDATLKVYQEFQALFVCHATHDIIYVKGQYKDFAKAREGKARKG